jgi:hypothetical protein
MRITATMLIAVLSLAGLMPVAPAAAAPSPLLEFASLDGALRWIGSYRSKPDPAGVPAVVHALSRLGAFKDPEQAGAYTGFIAGVIRANPGKAGDLISKMLPLPVGDQWVIVRAIAYSGHPDWRNLLRRVADRIPERKVMIDKHLAGTLPTLWQIPLDQKPSTWETVRGYVTFEKLRGKEPPKEIVLEASPELLDTFWGYYFATRAQRPISRIIAMLPMAKDVDSIERLTLGSMAKFTLASNAVRDGELLAMLKDAREHQPKPVATALTEVIDAAETVETARLRKDAMAAIEELRRKGPGSRRNVSLWGQVGQGALALGCIAAAVTGHVELGLPCVITGGVSSAALSYWEKQQ